MPSRPASSSDWPGASTGNNPRRARSAAAAVRGQPSAQSSTSTSTTSTSAPSSGPGTAGATRAGQSHRPRGTRSGTDRSREGCWTCRGRKVKCDELRPICGQCRRLNRYCDYGRRLPFKDSAAPALLDKFTNISRHTSPIWNRAVHYEPIYAPADPSIDELPPFQSLATDEEREIKAASRPPGYYMVVMTPEVFEEDEEASSEGEDEDEDDHEPASRPNYITDEREDDVTTASHTSSMSDAVTGAHTPAAGAAYGDLNPAGQPYLFSSIPTGPEQYSMHPSAMLGERWASQRSPDAMVQATVPFEVPPHPMYTGNSLYTAGPAARYEMVDQPPRLGYANQPILPLQSVLPSRPIQQSHPGQQALSPQASLYPSYDPPSQQLVPLTIQTQSWDNYSPPTPYELSATLSHSPVYAGGFPPPHPQRTLSLPNEHAEFSPGLAYQVPLVSTPRPVAQRTGTWPDPHSGQETGEQYHNEQTSGRGNERTDLNYHVRREG